jgi:hypothetical protein
MSDNKNANICLSLARLPDSLARLNTASPIDERWAFAPVRSDFPCHRYCLSKRMLSNFHHNVSSVRIFLIVFVFIIITTIQVGNK